MLSSDIGDVIWTPSFNIPISLTGDSCFEDTNKFWVSGILLRILSVSNFLFACFCRIKLCPVVVPIPTWTVLADPIWFAERYNAIFERLWFAGGITGST